MTVTGLENPATLTAGLVKNPSMVDTVPPATEVSLLLQLKPNGAAQAPKPKKSVIDTLRGSV